MSRAFVIAAAAALLFLAGPALAEDYAGSKIVDVGRGLIVFEHDGQKENLYYSPTMKIIDAKGMEHDTITGVRFLAKDNIVDIKTMYDKKQKKEFVVEIKFVSGKVAELPKVGANVNLKPDPNFKGLVGEFPTGDAQWQAYIQSAKVGDFTEFKRGNDAEPGRYETIDCGKNFATVAKVEYTFGKRTEIRTKFILPAGNGKAPMPPAKGTPGKKPAAKDSEELTIGDKKVACEKKVDGKTQTWTSPDVPFDGVVKVESKNYKFILTDFGRGKEP